MKLRKRVVVIHEANRACITLSGEILSSGRHGELSSFGRPPCLLQ
jgi:hypothetical protein